jgi:hypothetical protein
MITPSAGDNVPPPRREGYLLGPFGSFGIVYSDGSADITGGSPWSDTSSEVEITYDGGIVAPVTIILEKWDISVDPAEYVEDVEEDMGASATTITFPDISSADQEYRNPKYRRRFSHLGYRGF